MFASRLLVVVASILVLSAVAPGEIVYPPGGPPELIVVGTHTDHPIVPGGSLDDVRMSVTLSAAGGVATMTFTNVSVSPEESAVFKRIVLDLADDDTGAAVLWNGVILTNTANVSYRLWPYTVLPGYNPVITDGASMVQFRARAPAPKKGIGPGEVLQVGFNTSLPDGSDITDYLGFFGGGQDTESYTVGFHAISADTVFCGGSLSGVHTPEPATLVLLAAGAALLRRRRR